MHSSAKDRVENVDVSRLFEAELGVVEGHGAGDDCGSESLSQRGVWDSIGREKHDRTMDYPKGAKTYGKDGVVSCSAIIGRRNLQLTRSHRS